MTLAPGDAKEQGRREPADVHDADEIHLDDLTQVVERLLLDGAVVTDAGVVDEHIEPAMGLEELSDCFSMVRVSDVAGDRLDPLPALGRELIEAVAAAGGHNDMRSGLVQYAREASPETGRCPSDQRDPAVEAANERRPDGCLATTLHEPRQGIIPITPPPVVS